MSRSIRRRIKNLGVIQTKFYRIEPLFWFPRGKYRKRILWQQEFGKKCQRRYKPVAARAYRDCDYF